MRLPRRGLRGAPATASRLRRRGRPRTSAWRVIANAQAEALGHTLKFLVLGHQRLELPKALSDLLFGGAELIQNGHASPDERVTAISITCGRICTILASSLQATPCNLRFRGRHRRDHRLVRLCTRPGERPPSRPAAPREPASRAARRRAAVSPPARSSARPRRPSGRGDARRVDRAPSPGQRPGLADGRVGASRWLRALGAARGAPKPAQRVSQALGPAPL